MPSDSKPLDCASLHKCGCLPLAKQCAEHLTYVEIFLSLSLGQTIIPIFIMKKQYLERSQTDMWLLFKPTFTKPQGLLIKHHDTVSGLGPHQQSLS